MLTRELTPEIFAQWTFERDYHAGCFDDTPEITSYESLSKEEKDLYIEEAIYYLLYHPLNDMPVDILHKMKYRMYHFPER